ncbi:MAG: Translation initiation factor IF-3 [Parcubacteria group bacterium GW2011_GWA2_40_8]|nr:MAG: Translation initiation factor IF-3 [Parcubacteria group bacterium GW2011_GWA2_40_8]
MGEISTEEAIRVAKERGLDLLEVSPDSVPPVCRIVDIGKWKYEQAKKERVQRAHQKQVGDKVRIEMILRGRERANEAFARERFGEFTSLLAVPYKIEQDIKREPKGLSMIIAKGRSNNSQNNDHEQAKN